LSAFKFFPKSGNKIRLFAFVVCVFGLFLKIAIISTATAQIPPQVPSIGVLQPSVANGEAVALDPARGNCNACHQLPNTPKATGKSKLSVSLSGVRAKFSDDKKLRALIWDASQSYPQTIMPPYGKHRILSEAEIDDVVAWMLTQ
jgi:L-cysteine S-thiosulfotransferase